jgi:hypothetical protein
VNTAPPNAKPSKPINKFGQKQLGDYTSDDYDNYFDEVKILALIKPDSQLLGAPTANQQNGGPVSSA